MAAMSVPASSQAPKKRPSEISVWAAATGAKVALAEDNRMGGTCVIRGCVPKKLMVFASEYPGFIEEARAYGWDASAGAFDWPAFQAHLMRELDRLNSEEHLSDVVFYDPASGAPAPTDGRPIHEGLRPDFVWPDGAW